MSEQLAAMTCRQVRLHDFGAYKAMLKTRHKKRVTIAVKAENGMHNTDHDLHLNGHNQEHTQLVHTLEQMAP